jgi:hypothetical protein
MKMNYLLKSSNFEERKNNVFVFANIAGSGILIPTQHSRISRSRAQNNPVEKDNEQSSWLAKQETNPSTYNDILGVIGTSNVC